jgi:hypothetical protein
MPNQTHTEPYKGFWIESQFNGEGWTWTIWTLVEREKGKCLYSDSKLYIANWAAADKAKEWIDNFISPKMNTELNC